MSEEKSMNDYENELERSFQVLREGDILDVTVIGVSDTEVTVDLNYYTELYTGQLDNFHNTLYIRQSKSL